MVNLVQVVLVLVTVCQVLLSLTPVAVGVVPHHNQPEAQAVLAAVVMVEPQAMVVLLVLLTPVVEVVALL
jgi:hypothetical protein